MMDVFWGGNSDSDIIKRLEILTELLNCGGTINFWFYNTDLQLMRTNCKSLVLANIFKYTECLAYMEKHFKESSSPIVLSSYLGLMWGASKTNNPDNKTKENSYIVIGPVLNTSIPMDTIQKAFRDYKIDLSWRKGFIEMMHSIPIVASQTFFQYVLMLHFCSTGKKIEKSDIVFQESDHEKESSSGRSVEKYSDTNRVMTYRNEQEILNNIRSGNLNYGASLERAHQLSSGVRIKAASPLQQGIISAVSFTTLCVRAAIEGGLSPNIAYSVGDHYIQSLIDCERITDVRSINHAMYDDFVHRVYQHKHNDRYSKQIESLIQYIEFHLEDELKLDQLSKSLGYTTYYMSHKFKEETGITLKAYIKKLRIEKAKEFLTSTDYSIAKIAEMLHFCSASYFSSEFNKIENILPQEYRDKYKQI